jgi:hypothetical protein
MQTQAEPRATGSETDDDAKRSRERDADVLERGAFAPPPAPERSDQLPEEGPAPVEPNSEDDVT